MEKAANKVTAYGGFVRSASTHEYECLFITTCSALIAQNRASEKALELNNTQGANYDIDDVIVKTRIETTTYSEWEDSKEEKKVPAKVYVVTKWGESNYAPKVFESRKLAKDWMRILAANIIFDRYGDHLAVKGIERIDTCRVLEEAKDYPDVAISHTFIEIGRVEDGGDLIQLFETEVTE